MLQMKTQRIFKTTFPKVPQFTTIRRLVVSINEKTFRHITKGFQDKKRFVFLIKLRAGSHQCLTFFVICIFYEVFNKTGS